MNGKGDRDRTSDFEAYKKNYDRIFGKKKDRKAKDFKSFFSSAVPLSRPTK
jgi:hypothetical protein